MSCNTLVHKRQPEDPNASGAGDQWRDYKFEFAALTIGADAAILSASCSEPCSFGFEPARLTGQPLTRFLHVDDQAVILRLISECAQCADFPFHAQIRFGAEEKYRWVLAVVTRRLSDGKSTVEVQIVPTRNPADELEDLVERESRWNHALVGSDLGVWDHNIKAGQYYYSDYWRTMRGIPIGEEIDPSFEYWIESVHPDDREGVTDYVARQNTGDERYQVFQYRERHRAGHYIWIECRGAVVEWSRDGKPQRIIGTDIDITKRKQDEVELENLSRRLEFALDVSQIGVFEANLDTGMVEWDENGLKIFGLEGTDPIKRSSDWEDMLLPEDRDIALDQARRQVGRNQAFRNEYRIRRPDGSIRHVRARAAPFLNRGGERKVIGANWDVTDDVLLRQELAAAKDLAEARNLELEEAQARLKYNAVHDHLTGLPNRRYLEDLLDREMPVAAASKSPLAVLHVDLGRFKQINDTLGHEAGDMLLQEAARILRALATASDFVGHLGGDEFAFVSRTLGTPRRLAVLADRIIRQLCLPVAYQGHFIRIGASVGISMADGTASNAKQLLLNADIALYRAKSRGRNRYEFFSPETQNAIIETKRLSDEILRGIEGHEFIPYYQPQFNAEDLSLAGMESLVRWRHPERGIVAPNVFLPVAADLDVVSQIDGFILEQALADVDRWEKAGLDVGRISVNVSARRLEDPQLIRKLKNLAIRPGKVAFELLESIFLDDHDQMTGDTLANIRKLGIEIEIDDFGTGHASIISLMKINPHVLKIDRALVCTLPQSAEQRRLVASIVEIGKSLNIRVLAEGVETREHVRILQDIGCDMLQGYGLARPMPASDIPSFLAARSWLEN